jgi:hypothetical protein
LKVQNPKARNIYKLLVGNPEERRSLKRHRHKSDFNIKMEYWGVCFEDMN